MVHIVGQVGDGAVVGGRLKCVTEFELEVVGEEVPWSRVCLPILTCSSPLLNTPIKPRCHVKSRLNFPNQYPTPRLMPASYFLQFS